MRFLSRVLPSFLVAWLISFTLASLFHSQYVVNQLVNVDIDVTILQRLNLMWDDWVGLLPTYGSIIAIAFIIAFSIATWLLNKLPQFRYLIFILAGIIAFLTVLLSLNSVMNMHLIAGSRGWGFYTQLLAGALGGYSYIKLSNKLRQN
ncbi:MAG: hypothetical protein HWE10_05195 [Gammaproteobacteria bacterium]|nr:hypothetical protein [Gammaproteobacteria bacterium]